MVRLKKPLEKVEHYRITQLIERTDMSIIYGCVDERTGQEKVLKTPMCRMEEFLEEEIRVIRKLNKKGIEGIIESDEPLSHKGRRYLPLERLERELFQFLNEGDYFKQLGIFIEYMADVLYSLKEEGIVHRDIKPGNIMVNGKGELKLFDFGLAFDLNDGIEKTKGKIKNLEELYLKDPSSVKGSILERNTKPGILKGTIEYIAPELILKGRLPLPPSDMYSFGKTLIRVLEYFIYKKTRVPFAEITQKLLSSEKKKDSENKEAIRVIKKVVSLPDVLEEILVVSLAVEPKERPTPEGLKELSRQYCITK